MSADSTLVTPDILATVQGIVSQVLMVPPAKVQPETRLYDLGAESIDYLDLIFRIEEALGRKVPVSRWADFVGERLPGANLPDTITVAIVAEFAERERSRP